MHRYLSNLASERRRRPIAGFTIFELILVLTVLGILLAISAPNLEGLVPKYRLRSAARTLASQLEYVRVAAINRERWMGIHYVLEPRDPDEPPYYQVIPPAPEEDPFQPVEERQLLRKRSLPEGVRFSRLLLANNDAVQGGAIDVMFSPAGNVGSHIVVLEGPGDRFVSLKFNCITGILDYSETGDAAFRHYED